MNNTKKSRCIAISEFVWNVFFSAIYLYEAFSFFLCITFSLRCHTGRPGMIGESSVPIPHGIRKSKENSNFAIHYLSWLWTRSTFKQRKYIELQIAYNFGAIYNHACKYRKSFGFFHVKITCPFCPLLLPSAAQSFLLYNLRTGARVPQPVYWRRWVAWVKKGIEKYVV